MTPSSQHIVKFPNPCCRPNSTSVRDSFPAIQGNPGIAYFDNAATTQVPESVLKAVQSYYQAHAANPGRGAYDWAMEVEDVVEATRTAIASLTGLADKNGVIFTSGTTMSLNMVAQAWGRSALRAGDEVLICLTDHHSMTLPWEELAKEKGLILRPYRLHANGSIDLADFQAKVSDKTKICCVTHVNNTVGWVNDLKAVRNALPGSVFLNVDAAQSISHLPVDMAACGIDFLSFSGHKMFALGGIGGLCVSARAQDSMQPIFWGGGMAEYEASDPIFKRFEAGTLNMAGIISLQAACKFIDEVRSLTALPTLTRTLYKRLLSNPRLELLYEQKPYALDHLSGIASFTLDGVKSGEVADLLAEYGIFVRAGRHCAGARESVRMSLQIYNTEDEINRACDLLGDIGKRYA